MPGRFLLIIYLNSTMNIFKNALYPKLYLIHILIQQMISMIKCPPEYILLLYDNCSRVLWLWPWTDFFPRQTYTLFSRNALEKLKIVVTQCPCFRIYTPPVIPLCSCKIQKNCNVNIDLKDLTQQHWVYCSRTSLFTIPSVLPVIEQLHVALGGFWVVVELDVVDRHGVVRDTVVPN